MAPVEFSARSALLKERQKLPIFSAREKIVEEIQSNAAVIIVGETGSGKTTQIPQYLFDNGFASDGKLIACTQPRRVAAISLAQRVSQESGTKLGQRVGYSIRFEDCTSKETRIKYMTDGMLLREVLSDPLLSRYSVILLDEAHERTLRTDILFGLVKDLQKSGKRPDLKVVIMSATLDATKFSQYFDAKILYVAGRQFPTKLYYTVEPQSDFVDSCLVSTFQIHLEEAAGDILVFLTGQEDIESLEKLMNEYAKQLPPTAKKLIVCPLFANMPTHQQSKVFEPTPKDCRKVILSTNIAETSITISGIRYVIDAGLHKVRGYISRIGIESLMIQPISKASARQRMGRAGREAPGACYRLYTEDTFKTLDENESPEIMRCNMSSVILLLKASGVHDVLNFDYMDRPPRETLLRSLEELYGLDALDDQQKLTSLGKQMAEFPLDPPFAKVLLESKKYGCTQEVILVIALLSVESIFYTPNDKREEAMEAKKKFISYDGDHLTLLNVLKSYQSMGKDTKWCRENFINMRSMNHVQEVIKQLEQHCQRIGLSAQESCQQDYDKVLRCFLTGFFNKVALRQPDNTFRCLCTNQIVHIHPSSVLFHRKVDAVMYNELILTSRRYMRNVSAILPQWLMQAAPKFYNSGNSK